MVFEHRQRLLDKGELARWRHVGRRRGNKAENEEQLESWSHFFFFLLVVGEKVGSEFGKNRKFRMKTLSGVDRVFIVGGGGGGARFGVPRGIGSPCHE